MRLESPSFEHGGRIPKRHAREGEDLSPPLRWSDLPEGTQELALVCDDPDAPREEPWVHWVLYKIPTSVEGLAEGDGAGMPSGPNDFGEAGWGGPMPPKGHGVHHYHFHLYALDEPLDLEMDADKATLLEAMQGHVLEEAELVGTYERT